MIRAREPESSEERSEGEGTVDDPSKRYVVVDWSLLAGYVIRQKLSNLTYTVFWCESPGAMCQVILNYLFNLFSNQHES